MPPLLERHVVENEVGHRSRDAVHIPKPDGKGAAVVKLRDILNPFVADVLTSRRLQTLPCLPPRLPL